MSDELLSERIKQRMSRCKTCHGSLIYMSEGVEMACMDCSDWEVTRRGVVALERKLAHVRFRIGEAVVMLRGLESPVEFTDGGRTTTVVVDKADSLMCEIEDILEQLDDEV